MMEVKNREDTWMAGTTPQVSVIMPAYNAEKTIFQAIDSVRRQTYTNWELIIIDDCSNDDTRTIVHGFETEDNRIILLTSNENQGVAVARKRGAEAARSEWIAFLDSDDEWKEDKLDKQLRIKEEKDVDLVYTGSAFMDENGKRINWSLQVPETVTYKQLLKQNIISNSSVLIQRSAYLNSIVFGRNIHEDYACWLTYLYNGGRAAGINEDLLIYRISSGSKSGNKVNAAKMNWNTYKTVGLSPFEIMYYMIWYTIRGMKKYSSINANK